MQRPRRNLFPLLIFLFSCILITCSVAENETKKNVAVATLVTTSQYVAGAQVLMESLQHVNAIGDRILFYLLPDDDERSDISEQDVANLQDAGWETRRLDTETYSECRVSASEQYLVDETPTIKRYWGTCSKFAIWTLVEYDSVIYIDADSLVLNNFDSVHDLVLGAANDDSIVFFANGTPGFWDDPPTSTEFYGAFLAIRPSLSVHEYLHKVAQTYSAAQGELYLLNHVFRQYWKPLPRYTLVAQTEQLRPPTNPRSRQVDWSQVKVYDFSGLPETKPWIVYQLQQVTGDKYVHPYLGRIPAGTRNFYVYMEPQWIWNEYYDKVLERMKQRDMNTRETSDDKEL